MKTLNLIIIYILSFITFYLMLSSIGVILGQSYLNCIHSIGWFCIYTLFIGVWLSAFVSAEYYENNKAYFKNIGL